MTAILISWSFAFLWLLQRDRYAQFIRLDFIWLILLGFILCSSISLALLSSSKASTSVDSKLEFLLKLLILILPLFYMRAVDGEALSSYALAKRAVDKGNSSEEKGFGFTPSKASKDSPMGARTGIPLNALIGRIGSNLLKEMKEARGSALRNSVAQKLSIVDLRSNFVKHYGKQVETQGFVYRDPRLPQNTFVAFQFHIVCCAADALPVGCLVHSSLSEKLKNDSWVRIRAKAETLAENGETLPLLRASSVIESPRPQNPYAY